MLILFAECKFPFARRQKCVSARKAGARSLEDLQSAKINIILETCKRLTVFYFLYSLSITNIVWNVVKVSAPKGESFLFSTLRAMYEVFGYDGVGWTLEYLWQKIRYDRIVTPTGLMIERTYLYRLKQSR